MDGRFPPPFGLGLPPRPPLLVRDRSPLRNADTHADGLPRIRRSRFDDPFNSDILPPPPPPDPYRATQPRRSLLETPGIVPSVMPTLVTLPDVEVIILDNKQRLYAESVKSRLGECSIVAQIRLVPRPDGSIVSAIQDAGRRRLKFACSINEMNALHHSITVHILQGVPQEHRNMPLDDAVELIVSTSESLKKTVGDGASVPVKPHFTPPDDNLKYLLNLAIDKKFLAIEELDEVIDYFEHRRAELAKAQGVKPRKATVKQPLLPKPPTPTSEPELADDTKAMEDEQKKLQEKIFKLLKGEPIDDETFDLPIAGLSAVMSSNAGGTFSSTDDGTFQQVLNAIVSNPVLKSLAGVKPNVSAAAAVAAPRLPVTPLLSVRQPAPVPPVYGAYVPGGMTSFVPPEPFNGRPRPLLRAPGPPSLWPGY